MTIKYELPDGTKLPCLMLAGDGDGCPVTEIEVIAYDEAMVYKYATFGDCYKYAKHIKKEKSWQDEFEEWAADDEIYWSNDDMPVRFNYWKNKDTAIFEYKGSEVRSITRVTEYNWKTKDGWHKRKWRPYNSIEEVDMSCTYNRKEGGERVNITKCYMLGERLYICVYKENFSPEYFFDKFEKQDGSCSGVMEIC